MGTPNAANPIKRTKAYSYIRMSTKAQLNHEKNTGKIGVESNGQAKARAPQGHSPRPEFEEDGRAKGRLVFDRDAVPIDHRA